MVLSPPSQRDTLFVSAACGAALLKRARHNSRHGRYPRPQVVDFPEAQGRKDLQYDEEWLAVLRGTHHFMSLGRRAKALPGAPLASKHHFLPIPSRPGRKPGCDVHAVKS